MGKSGGIMIQPLWKKYASYLYEFHIESVASPFNPELNLHYKNGRYQLSTPNAVYSFGDLYNNFSSAFHQSKLDDLKINNVLILGFGLGSIPIILEKTFQKKYQYTAVEIDQSIVDLANKYTIPYIDSEIKIICEDATEFVNSCNNKFDLITVDLFLDDIIPDRFKQASFLGKLKKMISKDGLILYNHLAYTKEDLTEANTFYKEQFTPVFPECVYLEVKGNWMLVNDKKWTKK